NHRSGEQAGAVWVSGALVDGSTLVYKISPPRNLSGGLFFLYRFMRKQKPRQSSRRPTSGNSGIRQGSKSSQPKEAGCFPAPRVFPARIYAETVLAVNFE